MSAYEVLARVIGNACLFGLIALFLYLLFKPAPRSDRIKAKNEAYEKRQREIKEMQRIHTNPPEQNIREGIQGWPCRLCGGNTGKFFQSPVEYGQPKIDEVLCPSCMKLYAKHLEERRYPPEILAALKEHPEYEAAMEPKNIMPLRLWAEYRKREKDLAEGRLSKEDYQREYRQAVMGHAGMIASGYYKIKHAKELASRPKYSPSQDSKF